jgi:Putative DNA-binding domain
VDAEEALRLIRQGEGQAVEFKESFAGANDAIVSLCAFANAGGGTVFFGVTDDGALRDPSSSKKTLRDFANTAKENTDPRITPPIEPVTLDGQTVFAVTVEKARKGQVFSAFGRFYIRVGSTNQLMAIDEVRARILRGHPPDTRRPVAVPILGQVSLPKTEVYVNPDDRSADAQADWSEQPDRPNFGISRRGLRRLETEFEPSMAVEHVSGDQIAVFEWRFCGPRFRMEWRQATGSALARTHFLGRFDLSQPPMEDQKVGLNEMGFELRFHWRGRWRSELHRWVLTREELSAPPRAHWDIGDEILPPLYFDEREEVGVMFV